MTTCYLTCTSQTLQIIVLPAQELIKDKKISHRGVLQNCAMHAFITSKLDYCNSLLYGCRKMQFKKLQYVQNTAARIVRALLRLVNLITLRLFYFTFTGSLLVIVLFLKFFYQFSNHLITFHLAIWRTDLVINRIPGTCGPHLSRCQNNLDHSRKLTGTRLSQCVPLKWGIRYHLSLVLRKD